MAEVLGVSKQALHQFLHPTSKNIQDKTIIGICEKLKISVDKFTEDYDEWEKECVHNIYLIENAPSLMENMLNSRFVRKLLATVAREKFGASDDECKNIMYMDVKTQKAAISPANNYIRKERMMKNVNNPF